ncbi:MAG: phospho-N-acetylmuramoyl-pentapeptide-transferase [Prevotellaceae bacterium]|jgi:phospho-N-acetylmuramoyl-pentapeptide-transferase|nr:phospho-N-acetylmuramoyl-pentapeptide-transferase [Prevotellaceae bacterium]
MLYHLISYLGKLYNFPGERLFTYLSFRAGMGLLLALVMGLVFGKRIIRMLQRRLIGEEIRDLGLEGQLQKRGTPTMGGIIILLCILVPTLLLADLTSTYTWLMIVSTLWLGVLGFLDDYIKVFKKNKAGLQGKFKIVGQVGLGIIVSLTLFLSDSFVTMPGTEVQLFNHRLADFQTSLQNNISEPEKIMHPKSSPQPLLSEDGFEHAALPAAYASEWGSWGAAAVAQKSTKTTIPFFKNNEFEYAVLAPAFLGGYRELAGWIIFMLVTIFIITAVSNGANLTDGMDGLVSGVSITTCVTLSILAYLSSNVIYAGYLNIMYIPNSAEMVIFMAIVIGSLIGFLWYNSYPAQVFMGDTGSLALGGIIAVYAIIIRKELLIPILCGVFFVESLSVLIQVSYFKYTKRKRGQGQRVFLMAPLHHHYQKKGMPEAKIVTRFWIMAAMLAVATVLTLKVR